MAVAIAVTMNCVWGGNPVAVKLGLEAFPALLDRLSSVLPRYRLRRDLGAPRRHPAPSDHRRVEALLRAQRLLRGPDLAHERRLRSHHGGHGRGSHLGLPPRRGPARASRGRGGPAGRDPGARARHRVHRHRDGAPRRVRNGGARALLDRQLARAPERNPARDASRHDDPGDPRHRSGAGHVLADGARAAVVSRRRSSRPRPSRGRRSDGGPSPGSSFRGSSSREWAS